MPETSLHWVKEKTFIGTDSGNHSIVISTKDDDLGVRPSEMVLLALASCTAVDVVEILSKKRMPLESMDILIDSVQDPDPPWAFQKIHMKFRLKGKNLTEAAANQAINLSEDGYCCVAATLRGVAKISFEVEILS
jgi:putative redox protein